MAAGHDTDFEIEKKKEDFLIYQNSKRFFSSVNRKYFFVFYSFSQRYKVGSGQSHPFLFFGGW